MDFTSNSDNDNIDAVINDLGGCGRFQFLLAMVVCSAKIVASMSMMMMAFGNYNPGWTCLDNSTDTQSNFTNAALKGIANDTDKCQLFESCSNVAFTPGVYTIVTEWQLLCGVSWIPSLIISIQMLGVLLGSYISGYLGDKIGRKSTVYSSTLYSVIVNIIAIFSNSWQMFLVMRFMIGFGIPFMMNVSVVLALEFAQVSWRNAVMCFPWWSIGCLLFTFAAMLTEDWRYLHGIAAAMSLLCLIPCYWVPESLRWLVVNDKMKKSFAVVQNIAKINGAKEQPMERLQRVGKHCRTQTKSNDQSFLRLLRKGSRKATCILGLAFTTYSSVFYALSFGIKFMPGNFYTNMIIMFSAELPMALISSIIPNYIGRKRSIIIFLAIGSLGLFSIVGLDLRAEGKLHTVGILVSVVLTRITLDASWDVSMTYIGELYPTVIRSTSISYSSLMARVGGILAPYLIPDNPDTLFINYLIMATLVLVCCGLFVTLQETKGKPLDDTWGIKEPEPILLNDKQHTEGEHKEMNGDTHV